MTPKHIEVEYRSRISEEEYHTLIAFLNAHAEDLGEDDKSIHFFLFPDKTLKVTDNISQESAKITLKLNRIGNGAMFEEIEVPIARADVDKMVRMFDIFGFDHLIEPIVKRHNYTYKGVELAVKYSESWQYHVELEVIIGDESEHAAAEAKIRAVADELKLHLMTEEELTIFTTELEDIYRKNKAPTI